MGLVCGKTENYLLCKVYEGKTICLSIYMVYFSYVWVFFRNADPLIAVGATNRWLLLILISYFIISVFSNKERIKYNGA